MTKQMADRVAELAKQIVTTNDDCLFVSSKLKNTAKLLEAFAEKIEIELAPTPPAP